MTPVLIALLAASTMTAGGPATGAQLYAHRIALAAADDECALFSRPERALLDALTARSRDDAARAGDPATALDQFEAGHAAPPASCADSAITTAAEAHRAHADALSQTHEIAFPGVYQDWVSERRDRGVPLWRVRQSDQGRTAILGLHAGADGDVMAVALRSAAEPAFAVIVVRDPSRQAEPLDFSAGGLLPTPFENVLSAWGGASGGHRRISASARLDMDMAARLAPAGGAGAYAFAFPDTAVMALRALAPREGVRIDLVGGRGQILDTLWFEVGMFNAALAVQALELPEPEPASAATASR
ncbi:hypothetical protein ACWCOP_08155 [Maricaulaceae bacterium MS644]